MSKLALKGGEPVAPEGLKVKWPVFDDTDRQALLEVLESGKWFRFDYADQNESKVGQFEIEFARFHQAKYGVAVSSGTAALEVALDAAGVEAGDEVIVPAVTFIATATAVVLVNAVPVFVDIDPETYQISPEAIEAAITDKTKAVVPVHYGGYPADMDRITEIAKKHNLVVVEDCAHAHGTEWRGRKVGAIGDMGAFSFQMSKTLTCGEGGIVLTDSEELAGKCYSYHHIGRIAGRPFYEHWVAAQNFRMTEFQGALLLSQMRRLPEQTDIRHENGEYLAKGLEEIEGVSALRRDPRVTKHGYYFFLIRYNSEGFKGLPRAKFLEALAAEGIPAGTAYGVPVYKNPVFWQMQFGRTGCPIKCPLYGREMDYSKVCCPTAERVCESEQVSLYNNYLLGPRSNVDLILEAIKKIRENVDELVEK